MKAQCVFLRMASVCVAVAAMALSTRAANVTFAWDANPEADLAGYKLFYGPTPGGYTNHVALGKVTTHTINLVDGAVYYLALSAVNSNTLESALTTELRYPPPPNVPPTIATITDRTISEDAAQQTVNLTGIGPGAGDSQTVQVTATSGNSSLIPNPTVTYTSGTTGTLRFTPTPNASGSALITVTVDDGQSQDNTTTTTFTVTVQAVNDGPALGVIGNQAVPEDTAATVVLHVTDVDTAIGNLTLSAASSNTGLVPVSNVNFSGSGTNRTMVVTPVANQSGTANITVTVSDGSLSANRVFTLTVGAAADQPTISGIADVTTDEDVETALIAFTVADPDTAATSLTVRAASSDTSLIPTNRIIFSGTSGARNVRLRPTTNQSGSATITLTVSDGTLTANTSFNFTVRAVNDPPTITQVTDRTLTEDTQTNPIGFVIDDEETPLNSLEVTATSSNPNIVPEATIFLAGTGSNRTVVVRPATNAVGSAVITLTVNDGAASASKSFTATYLAVNDAPFVSNPPDLTINKLNPVPPIPFTLSDVESAVSALTITLSSSNITLLRTTNMIVSGTGTNRTLTLVPTANQIGTSLLGIAVTDGGATNRVFFRLTVTGSNNAPVLTVPGPLAGNAGASIPVRGLRVTDLDVGTNSLNFTLSAPNGFLTVSTSILAGVKASQVSGNNSGAVTIIAPLAALNTTLTNASGVSYASRADFSGTETLVVTVSDNGHAGTGGAKTDTENVLIQVTGTTGNSLEVWRARYFSSADLQDPSKETTVWGDLADPDGDGRHNLMEFALGLNPLGSEPQEFAFVSQTINSGGNQYLTLTFNSRINEPLLQYIPEVSPDNTTWSATAQRIAATPVNSEFERVTYQDTAPITSENTRFIRLRVVLTSP